VLRPVKVSVKKFRRNRTECLYLETKICRKESTLFNRIHEQSFGGLGGRYTDYLPVDSFCIHCMDFLYTHFCAETRLFFINTSLYPWNESTRKKVD
jgi:hypothetical protein